MVHRENREQRIQAYKDLQERLQAEEDKNKPKIRERKGDTK